MVVEVVVVHPTVTIIKTESGQREVPTNWWPTPPMVGQHWDLNLEPIKTSADQYALLNEYLRRG